MENVIYLVVEETFYGKDILHKAFKTHKGAFDFIDQLTEEDFGYRLNYSKYVFKYGDYTIRAIDLGE